MFSLLLGAGCALVGSSLCAQTPSPQPPQPASPQSASPQPPPSPPAYTQPPTSMRQIIRAEAERRAATQRAAAQAASTQPAAAQPGLAQPGQPQPGSAPPPSTPATSTPAISTPAAPAVPLQPVSATSQVPAAVKNVRIGHDKTGSVIEIVTSRPVSPALQTLLNPPRLVIDLPNSNVAVKQRYLAPAKGSDPFGDLHVDQFQEAPPVTRVLVDLHEAKQYTWDAAGDRLTIRVKPPEEPKAQLPPPAQPPTVSTFGAAAQPALVPVASRPAGSAVLAGSRIGNGSSVTASTETAVLHIARGGELHVCPGSTVSVTASKNTQDLMFGMSTGTLETHYHLNAVSDAVLTPDFRILLAGPGDFDYAISANSHGDTCIRALVGNNASLLVSELMGDRTYQVKPTEQVVFHDGRIDRVSNDVPFDCGCASPPPPVMRASVPPAATTVAETNLPPNVQLPSSSAATSRAALDPMLPPMPNSSRPAISGPPGSQVNIASARADSAPLAPKSKQADIHVQIEAPLVFRGADKARPPVQTASNMPPAAPAGLPKTEPAAPAPALVPPPNPIEQQSAPKQHRGFFGRVKGFFSSVFH